MDDEPIIPIPIPRFTPSESANPASIRIFLQAGIGKFNCHPALKRKHAHNHQA